ncbi:EAL domain-containing protein [Kineococcus glutinatus]|uniref:Diguanylate cyclase (GGDEF)-like protein n=1 Tax=Kineococcus glutinatus TaxID=1070872 RepID=A0ABP9HN03_9ACTN
MRARSRLRLACLTSSLQTCHQESWLGVVEEAARLDVDLLTVVGREFGDPRGLAAQANVVYDLLDPAAFDGFLVWTTKLGLHGGGHGLAALAARLAGRPVVSGEASLGDAPRVSFGEETGSAELVRHLVGVHGKRRVAYLRGPATHLGGRLRLRGYLQALREAGIEPDPALVSPPLGSFHPLDAGMDVVVRMLTSGRPPDAVVAANDGLAVGVVSACLRLGLRVPEDVAVVGFDDYTTLEHFDIGATDGAGDGAGTLHVGAASLALTTVRVPFRAVGERAVRTLVDLVAGRAVPSEALLPCELVVRRSCGCPPVVPQLTTADDETVAAALRATTGRKHVAPDEADWAKDLVAGLRAAVADEGRHLLAVAERLFRYSINLGEGLDPWGEVLGVLRSAAQDDGAAARAVVDVEQCWLYLRRLVERQADVVRDVGQELLSASAQQRCLPALVEQLPRLGIDTCYVAAYGDPGGPPGAWEPGRLPAAGARLLLAHERGRTAPAGPADAGFPAAELLPPGRWEGLAGRSAVLLPLHVTDRHLGYVVLALGPRSGAVYESVAHQLATGLHTSLLLEEQERARDDLERRVAERTAELARANGELLAQVAERVRAEQALAHQATHDTLTELPNRRLLHEQLGIAAARPGRRGRSVAVLFCDLDNFKWINDHLGHAAGDDLLRLFAQQLRRATGPHDVIARFGGDEFVVVASDLAGPAEVARLAERVLAGCVGTYRIKGRDVFVNVSIGATVAVAGETSADQLLSEADSALHLAKRRGRGVVAMFDSSLQDEIGRRVAVESGLHDALRHDALELLYQPKIDLGTGRTVAVEALLRWRHPSRGLVAPADFLDIAEESGLVVDIGTWVLRRACREARQWQRAGAGGPVVQVNLAARQLSDPRLLEHVDAALDDSGLDPRLLGVEVTESRLLADVARTGTVLADLADRGVHVSLDDFGTGYSSLSWLQQLPVHEVKLDRSFIADIVANEHDQRIVRSVIDLAHVLDLVVVGEGIETPAQRHLLASAGCDFGQGFHLGRPVPRAVLQERLLAGR